MNKFEDPEYRRKAYECSVFLAEPADEELRLAIDYINKLEEELAVTEQTARVAWNLIQLYSGGFDGLP